MSWTDYPALGERCYFLTLPNGLAVRVLPKPGFAEKFAFLGTNFGSDDVCFTWNGERHTVPDGTAHFLEHRMFSLPDCDPEDAFSRLGAQVNAFTDYAMTGYYFSCTEHFDDCLRLLLRMVMTPDFPCAAMASEREVIADEIALYADSPADCAQERLYRALYRRHPIRTPITGTRTSIRRVTPEVLQLCFDAFYRPDNMALIVMGDVDAERVAELDEADLEPLHSGYRAPYILAAAKAVASGKLDLEKTGLLPCTEARAELKKLNGVGDKVANCVVLFGLHQLDAFPVDVWIKRALAENLPKGFDPSTLGKYAGLAQQYMFYHARETASER